jgi:hypothetical protein
MIVDQSEVHRGREQRASAGAFSLTGDEVPIMQILGRLSLPEKEAV